MSPPTRFALCRSRSAGRMTERASTRSRNPGANRSICCSIARQHVGGRRVRHVAVRPRHVLARRRARRIEERRLRQEHEGPLGDASLPCRRAPTRAISAKAAAQMHGAALRARRRAPRDRRIERPIHFEHAHAVPIALELAPVPRRQSVAGDRAGTASATDRTGRRARAADRRATSTRVPATISPPSDSQVRRQRVRSASAPRLAACTQPATCAIAPSTRPTPAVSG